MIGGSGAGVYVHQQNAARQAEAAALVQQQEEQARLDAEQAAQEAAAKAAAEAEAARQAEAEKIAAEQAAQKLAAEQAEAARLAAEQAAEEEAEEAARAAAAEQAAQEQAAPQGATEGTSSGPSDGATSGPGSNHEDDGLPSFGPVGGSSSAAPESYEDTIRRYGQDYIGKPEPSGTQGNQSGFVKDGSAKWDSSIGGWTVERSFGTYVIFPNGNSANLGK